MATKTYRGKTLWTLPSRGRGTCPICKATRIKCLHELVLGDGSKVKVCKKCQHAKVQSL